jgi:predicted nucleic acid-binding protein
MGPTDAQADGCGSRDLDRGRSSVNAVVDTNVVAYFVLGTEPFVHEARAFMAAIDHAWAPAVWEVELANVLWMATRHDVLTIEEASKRLALTDRLGILSIPTRALWQGALVRAHQSNVAVYDTLFVELAVRESLPLATFDAALLRTFPGIAVRPSAITPR